jgi:hypothetical protein
MKTKTILFLCALAAFIFSCKKDKEIVDPIFEFVSFAGPSLINVNEFTNSTVAVPVVVQLWAFKPYSEVITLTLEITGNNTQEGVDFKVTPSDGLKIQAGKLTSDTLWVTTIDNFAGATQARTFDVKIKSVSKGDIKIGLGPTAKTNASITFNIIDDECSNTSAIYNSATFKNSLNWGYVDGVWNETGVALSATGSVAGDKVTVAGDLIYYDGFIPGNISLVLTLTPNSPGAPKGKATFGALDLGMATDGYTYRLLEIGEGAFDLCSKTITTKFDLQYDNAGTWTNYYYVGSVYTVK